ncbi:hypothetical protein BJ170DRAFT_314229 [Xylariales sp. AK1849]|nr:hypothetical protein BJ170DRAFT_314229 [Xylariales sp. AK1849]
MAAQLQANLAVNDTGRKWPSFIVDFESALTPDFRNLILLGVICLLGASWAAKDALLRYARKGSIPATKHFDCMGNIHSLDTLEWEKEKPERVYSFADKYNLTMGVKKTDINWITRMDQQYAERIEERRKILEQYPGALGCIDRAPAADTVNELYIFIFTHYLPKRYPSIFRINTKTATCNNMILNEKYPLTPPADPMVTLRHLALAVDEDFLMLLPSPDGDGYSLQAFTWLYPVGFDPQDKLGKTLAELHGPVPSYREHLQKSMDRYFGRVAPGTVVNRVNWAVATSSTLCERGEYHLYSEDQVSSTTEIDLDDTWVRCELQTLFALPGGGKVLSVHLYLYPIREIKDAGLTEEMCRAIDGFGAGNAAGFSLYKRVPVWGETVKQFLRS